MYLRYFGLSEKPFNITPDSYFLYLDSKLQDILSALTLEINDRRGLIGLVGEAGSGKTTLINGLLEKLDRRTKTALLFNFSRSVPFEQLLATALVDLGVTKPGESYPLVEGIKKLHEFAIEQLISGGNVLLIMDEAQVLDPAAFENLRLLSNLETRKNKLVQILLVGSPHLKKSEAIKEFCEFNHRITKWYHIEPLNKSAVHAYIMHRLSVAGGTGKLKFTKRAAARIFKYSGGNPRSINQLCHRALVLAYCQDKFVIGKRIIETATRDLQGSLWRKKPKRMSTFVSRFVPLAAGLIIGIAVAIVGKGFIGERFLGFLSWRGLGFEEKNTASVSTLSQSPYLRRPINQNKLGAAFNKKDEVTELDISLLLDEQESREQLCKLYELADSHSAIEIGCPDLFYWRGPEVRYQEFMRPFRIRVKGRAGQPKTFLVVKKITGEGALVSDRQGRTNLVTDDVITSHRARESSWIYPHKFDNELCMGMFGPEVLEVQNLLINVGYNVYAHGYFDNTTHTEMERFQQEYGLDVNGVVSHDTKALLFQLSG